MNVPATIDQSLVAGILAGLAVLLVVLGASLLQAERAFSRRLRVFIANQAGAIGDDNGTDVARPTISLYRRLNTTFARSRLSTAIRRELVRAGSPLQPNQFIYLRLTSTAIGLLAGLAAATQVSALFQPILVLSGTAVGWLTPIMIIRSMQRRRVAAFERHLPDAIDIMSGSLEAGSSLPMALELVGREIPPPVSTEFSRALREVGLGMSLDDALLTMVDRLRSDDLDMMATAVAIQFRVGGNLAEVLKVIAHTIRERVRIRGDIQALTAQQTISANILTLMPVGLAAFLMVLNPTYEMRLFDPGLPQFATLGAIVMIVLAYIILKRIVTIDV